MKAILWLLLETVASLVAGLCLLRAYAWSLGIAPLNNQLVNFSHAITQWLVKPVRQIVKPAGRYDWSSLVGALLLALLTSVAFYLLLGMGLSVARVPLLAVLWLIRWALYLAMMLIIGSALLSLINPHAPLAYPLRALSDPLMRPFRRVLPLFGSFDLSPLVAILVIQILLVLFDPTVVMNMLGGAVMGYQGD
ncbi:MAG: YggT family protein [Lautropia sp.]|nr:YggT family protein [Lautropia sp.]